MTNELPIKAMIPVARKVISDVATLVYSHGGFEDFVDINIKKIKLAKSDEQIQIENLLMPYFIATLLDWEVLQSVLAITAVSKVHTEKKLLEAVKRSATEYGINVNNKTLDALLADIKAVSAIEYNEILATSGNEIAQVKNFLAYALARKVAKSLVLELGELTKQLASYLTKKEIRKSIWGSLGKVIPDIQNKHYEKMQGFSVGGELLVKKNIWRVARPIDRPCLMVKDEVRAVGKKFSNGFYAPKVHNNCWINGQLVLSKRGWIKVENVLIGDELLSMDERFSTIFAPVRNVWQLSTDTKYVLNGKTLRGEFTENHKMIEISNWNWKYNKDNRRFKFTEIRNCNNRAHTFLQSAYNDRELEISDNQVRFIAWYLSEGCKGIWGKQGKSVTLSQAKEPNRSIMINDIQAFMREFDPDGKIWISKSLNVQIKSDKLFDWLPSGKSFEKRMPEWCLHLNRRQSRLLIETFAMGDGTRTTGATFDGYVCKDSICLFTSSDLLFADLSIVIQNCEWNLSFYKQKDGWIKHRNGIYLTKHSCWYIRIKTSKLYFVESHQIKKVYGNFTATGIELEYGNKILSSKDGRCIWTHNCLCILESFQISKQAILNINLRYGN